MTKQLKGESIVLDIFRVGAAFAVLFGHSFSFSGMTVFRDQAYFPYVQNIAVVIFFILSGFLTMHSLSVKNENHTYRFDDFVKRRALRILKELLPCMVLVMLIDYMAIRINNERYQFVKAYNVIQFIGNMFMLQNMGPDAILSRFFIPFGSARPIWTLSIEWWLYMLCGGIYITLSNQRPIKWKEIFLFLFFLFMICGYLITGRGGGLGFAFLLGVTGYYIYSNLEFKVSVGLFVFGVLAYVVYGMKLKEAYTVYSILLIGIIFIAAVKMGG